MKNNRLVEMTYTRLKLGAIAMLVGALLMGQMPTIDAKSPKHCPINIGYPNGISPIPLTPDCLFPIVIPGRTTTIHSGSVAEPTIAVNPKDCDRIVACWQQSRIFNGGSLEVGIAYSKNKGKSWKRTTVPLQICNGGINTRVSDVWLSYSADGKVLYLSALTLNSLQDTNTQNQMAVISSISKDNGKHWSAPSFLYASAEYLSEPDGIFPSPDKNSVTADPNIAKNAYVVYDSFVPAYSFHSDTYFNKTTDAGTTWSPNRIIYNPFPDLVNTGLSNNEYNDCQTIDNVVVVQPKTNLCSPKTNGDLLNFMVRLYAKPGATDLDYMQDSWPYQHTNFDIAFVRSSDEGETWNSSATIVTSFSDSLVYTGGYTYSGGQPSEGIGKLMRTGDMTPSYNVNPKNGNLYVAYQTGEFTPNQLPLIGLRASYDGGYTWTNSALVSRTPLDAPNPQAFTPFVAVTENGYVGILYNDFRKNSSSFSPETKVDAWLAIYRETGDPTGGSTGIGLDFVKEVRLSKHSYIAENGPTTSQGIMTNGDYAFLTTHHSTFYAIFTMSKNGPFAPPMTLINDPESSTALLLDDNYRSAPFIRSVKP